jgi:phosphate starvation-inducible PhoH-like protein
MTRAKAPSVQRRTAKRPTKRSAPLQEANVEAQSDFSIPRPERVNRQPIEALNESQRRYINAIKSFELIFATGPAGTGKTWICGALAAQALNEGVIDKIIITRPAVEAGESLGFLPGELEDKFDPFLRPFKDVLNERLGKSYVDYLMKVGRIEAAPLAYMRGRTFKNAFVILDEAQNTTPNQMKLFLTRIGSDCKIVVNGDTRQKDIHGVSGLEDAIRRLSHIPSVKCVGFSRKDVVRSGLCQEVIEAYESDD